MHDHDLPASWAEHRGDIDAARSAGYFDDLAAHQLAGLVCVDAATVALCACGWRSGHRRTRTIALESFDAHLQNLGVAPASPDVLP